MTSAEAKTENGPHHGCGTQGRLRSRNRQADALQWFASDDSEGWPLAPAGGVPVGFLVVRGATRTLRAVPRRPLSHSSSGLFVLAPSRSHTPTLESAARPAPRTRYRSARAHLTAWNHAAFRHSAPLGRPGRRPTSLRLHSGSVLVNGRFR